MTPNVNYKQLKENYLFFEISRRVAEFQKSHPEKEILRMGIGDVTLPLCRAVVDATKKAATDKGKATTLHG